MSGETSLLEGKPGFAMDFNFFVEDNTVVIDEADVREQQGCVRARVLLWRVRGGGCFPATRAGDVAVCCLCCSMFCAAVSDVEVGRCFFPAESRGESCCSIQVQHCGWISPVFEHLHAVGRGLSTSSGTGTLTSGMLSGTQLIVS